MSYNVYGVGNALVDIQARISDETLCRLEYAKGLMTLVDEEAQRRVLGAIEGSSMSRCAGGSAANTIVGVSGFGGTAAFTGKVCDDDLGAFFLEDMRRLGVSASAPPSLAGQTGTCVVLITEDAQRTMLTHLGVSADLGPEDVDAEKIRAAEYVYVEGYLFGDEPTYSAAVRVIELAKAYGVKVALTVSDAFVVDSCRDKLQSVIEGSVDLLFCNLDEARSLTGKEDPVDCVHEIHRHTESVAVTMGGDGSILMHAGELIPVEAVAVDAIDTTGAGDMYAAGVLFGITNGLSWREAGNLASRAAARVVSEMGARLQDEQEYEEIRRLCR